MGKFNGNRSNQKQGKGTSRNTKYNSKTKNANKQFEEGTTTKTNEGYCNDPSWYFKNPVSAKKAGSLNFTYPLGYTLDLDSALFAAKPEIGQQTFPGMMKLDVMPALPASKDAASALNVASFKLYTFIRHENSGSRNYDAPDLLLYVLGVAELYAYVNWLQRTYLVANSYSVENAYIPRTMCALENIDYDDVIANMAEFAYQLDNRLNKLRAYRCPGDMPIFARRAFMFKDIYVEGPSVKDQMYFFHPAAFYLFGFDPDGAGMLTATQLEELTGPAEGGKMKVADLFRGFDTLMASISSQEDFSIMSGDILKAYGANTITIGAFDPAPSVAFTPVYNTEILEQIQNCTVYGRTSVDAGTNRSFNVTYDTNIHQNATKAYLVCDPTVTFEESVNSLQICTKARRDFSSSRIMNSYKLDPTPIDVMENSRLMAITTEIEKYDDAQNVTHYEKHHVLCGSEMITGCSVGYYGIDSTDGHKFFTSMEVAYVNPYMAEGDIDGALQELRLVSLLSHFRFSPCMHAIATKPNESGSFAVANAWYVFEPSEYTIVTRQSLERLHDTAILSMLNV